MDDKSSINVAAIDMSKKYKQPFNFFFTFSIIN